MHVNICNCIEANEYHCHDAPIYQTLVTLCSVLSNFPSDKFAGHRVGGWAVRIPSADSGLSLGNLERAELCWQEYCLIMQKIMSGASRMGVDKGNFSGLLG